MHTSGWERSLATHTHAMENRNKRPRLNPRPLTFVGMYRCPPKYQVV